VSMPFIPEGHRALVVEDAADARAILQEVVRSRGDIPVCVGTVEEAIALLHTERFCYVLLDQQLPSVAGAEPMLGGGEHILVAARKLEHRRNAEGWHVMPILIVTGYSSDPDFVSKMYDLGCDGFIAKPLTPNIEKLLDRIRACLGRAERSEHDRCGSISPSVHATVDTARVTLAMDGTPAGGRTAVTICGVPRELRDRTFVVLLHLVAVHKRAAGLWEARDALGFGRSRNAPSRVREAFDGLVPEDFEVIEGDRRGQFRLNPAIVVEPVAWDALLSHPDVEVRKIAAEMRKKDKRA
jgi:DNA-binding response OmpR family regulator